MCDFIFFYQNKLIGIFATTLFFFCSIANAQTKDSIKMFYFYRNQAEMNILDSEFAIAVDNYKKSIIYNPQFGSDSYNACLCALECNKYEDATWFASKLVDKGVPMDFFHKNSLFARLAKCQEWKNYISQNPKPKYNKALHKKLDSLLIADQKFRFSFNRDSMLYRDTLTRLEVLKIFKDYSYPTEEMTGLWMYSDSTINWGWSPLDIIMIHQIKLNPIEYISYLEDRVYDGTMENSVFAMHSKNFLPDSNYFFDCLRESGSTIIRVLDELYTCCCKEEIMIDKNRNRIFMNSMHDQRLKIDFKQNTDKRFIIGEGYAEYGTSNGNDDFEIIKKQLINDRNFILYKTEKKQ